MLDSTLLRHVVRLSVDDSLLAAWLPLVPELPSIELVLRVLCIPEHQHHHTLHAGHVALERLGWIGSILKCYSIKLTLQEDMLGYLRFEHRTMLDNDDLVEVGATIFILAHPLCSRGLKDAMEAKGSVLLSNLQPRRLL